jgi:DNA-binding MarR family transcriptional regulator
MKAGVTASMCHAASRLGRTVSLALEDSILSPAAYRLLAHLTTGGDSAATELAEKLRVSRPVITATVDWLMERELVSRSPDPADGRRVRIKPTRKGKAAIRDADRLVAARLTELLSLLETEEAHVVAAGLHHLHRALDEDRRRRHARLRKEAES